MTDFNIIPVDGYRIIKTRLEDGTLKLSRVSDEGTLPAQCGGDDMERFNEMRREVDVLVDGLKAQDFWQRAECEFVRKLCKVELSADKLPAQESPNALDMVAEPVPVRRGDDALANDLHPRKVPD